MPTISYKRFSGEVPREQPHLLQETFAQLAENCDLVDGSLTPMRGGLLLRNMLSNPVKGIFTLDGINFYTWAVETQAFRSPVIDDTYNRFYFLQPSVGQFMVGSTLGMAYNGPSPASGSYRAGVPKPLTPPVLTLLERSDWPDHPGAALTAEAWWDEAGTAHNKVTVNLVQLSVLRSYSFTPPTKPADPEILPVLRVRLRATDSKGEVFSLDLRPSEKARSEAIPGGIEATLSEGGGTAQIDLKYGVFETRAYVYTFENTMQEESSASQPAMIAVTYMQAVQVVTGTQDFSSFVPYSKTNIYRTYGTSAKYLKTAVDTVNITTFRDTNVNASKVGNALESEEWDPPPVGLQGVDITPNGWFVGFKGNTLYMSEPYRPHAWPYIVPLPAAIRGVRTARNSVVVTTADGLYILNGAFPVNAQPTKVSLPQSGLSHRTMINVDGGVAYASNDGIVVVEGASATMQAGQQLFTRKKWRERYEAALSDTSMIFGYHDGCLVMTSRTMNQGFVIRLEEAIGQFTRTNQGYDSIFHLPVTDTLYYSIGNNVYRFNTGGALTADWWGKDFVFPVPVTFGAGRIDCDGPVRMRLYADGILVADRNLVHGHFRLGNLLKQLRWSVRLTTSSVVREFALGRSMLDLKTV